jgi:hypothetical protein
MKSSVVEEPSTSFDGLMFDYLAFVLQQLKQLEEHLVSSRHSVLVFVLRLTFVSHLAQPGHLGVTCGLLL